MLREQLQELSAELINNHPYVDFGGCCVVAAHVAKRMAECGIECRITTGQRGNDKVNLNKIRPHIVDNLDKRAWEDNGLDFAHVVVEFRDRNKGPWYGFDSTRGVMRFREFWDDAGWDRCTGEFTIEEATALANANSWNDTFDRNEICVLRKRIDDFFWNL